MQAFKRKITYFYQYHNENVGPTVGYLKLELRGDRVKIIVNIQEPAGLPYKGADLYFYHETGDFLTAVKVDHIDAMNGVLTYQTRTDWQYFFDTGRDLYTFDGAVVAYNDSHYFVGDFKDISRKGQRFVWEMPQRPKEIKAAEPEFSAELTDINAESGRVKAVSPMNEKSEGTKVTSPADDELYPCKDCPYQEKRKEISGDEDGFAQMIEEYPKLPLYGATELFSCVRIHPKDIGRLDMRNWKLGVNSFLTHGFYTYQYLLLGKMRLADGGEKNVIGVPGVYSGREKYLANMFGFEQFIPVQKTGIKTGEFGYWVVELR